MLCHNIDQRGRVINNASSATLASTDGTRGPQFSQVNCSLASLMGADGLSFGVMPNDIIVKRKSESKPYIPNAKSELDFNNEVLVVTTTNSTSSYSLIP